MRLCLLAGALALTEVLGGRETRRNSRSASLQSPVGISVPTADPNRPSPKDDEPVSIRPFDAITFSLGDLWP